MFMDSLFQALIFDWINRLKIKKKKILKNNKKEMKEVKNKNLKKEIKK